MAKPLIVYTTNFYPAAEAPHHGIFFQDHAKALSLIADVAVLHVEIPSWRSVRRLKPHADTRYDDQVFVWQGSTPVLSHRFRGRIEKAENETVRRGLHRIEREFGKAPDFVIAQNVLPSGKWANLIKQEYGIPFGTIEHFTFLERMLKEQYDEIVHVYSEASFISGVSNSVKDLLVGYLPYDQHSKTGVIGNVIGPEFQNHSLKPPPESEIFKWIFVGPDSFKKGPELLHQVFSGLKDQNWHLTIVGSGEFSKFNNDDRLKGRITFLNNLTRHEMIELMQQHHALISTSHIETFGMAILEMMSLGRPVVATKSGGPQDFVTPSCGILTNVGAADELQKAISHLQDDYHNYDPQKIRDHALQRYGQRVYSERIRNLISVFSDAQLNYDE